MRALLEGTTNWESFRRHSLKATLLIWCARAGFDKETRAVLGHHCSALSGSEVVDSRHLQTRALRKLGLVLKRVRAGLSIEDDSMKEYGVISTHAPFTTVMAARTPLPTPAAAGVAEQEKNLEVAAADAVDAAVEEAVELEELQSVKEEEFNQQNLEAAAAELTLFPVEVVAAGVVEIESSSGSESETSSSDDDSSSSDTAAHGQGPQTVEDVPEGLEYYKHAKSGLVDCCKVGELVTMCKTQLGTRNWHARFLWCIQSASDAFQRTTNAFVVVSN